MNTSLMIHRGGQHVAREQLRHAGTPAATATWQPIPHHTLLDEVEAALTRNELRITDQQHALAHDGLRYFGLLQIANGQNPSDHAWILGLRNSHDQTFPAGLVVGSRVLVCDNLAFSGEIVIARRHTRWILRDLPGLVMSGVGQLTDRWHSQEDRFACYRSHRLKDATAHDLVIRTLDVQAITTHQVKEVLREWRQPIYPEFRDRTLWSLFNAFTHVLGKGSVWALSRRSQVLHGVFDAQCGLTSRTDRNPDLVRTA